MTLSSLLWLLSLLLLSSMLFIFGCNTWDVGWTWRRVHFSASAAFILTSSAGVMASHKRVSDKVKDSSQIIKHHNAIYLQNVSLIFGFFTIRKSDAFLSVYLTDLDSRFWTKTNFNKICLQWGLNLQPSDHHSYALPTELSQHSVASLNLHGLFKVML